MTCVPTNSTKLRGTEKYEPKPVSAALAGTGVDERAGVLLWERVAGILRFVRTQRSLAIALWLAMLMLVAAGELLPGQSEPMMWLARSHLSDKLMHLTAYAAVAWIAAAAMDTGLMLVCVIVSECVGIALEIAQHYVPGRSTDIYDVLANTVGVLLGVVSGLWVVGSFLNMRRPGKVSSSA